MLSDAIFQCCGLPATVHTRIHCGLFVVSRDSAVEKGGGRKFSNPQIRMEVKLRNDMFSIRPASTICVLFLGHSPVIQDNLFVHRVGLGTESWSPTQKTHPPPIQTGEQTEEPKTGRACVLPCERGPEVFSHDINTISHGEGAKPNHALRHQY